MIWLAIPIAYILIWLVAAAIGMRHVDRDQHPKLVRSDQELVFMLAFAWPATALIGLVFGIAAGLFWLTKKAARVG